MQQMDTIITSRWIIPVIPENQVLEDHSILIQQGKIHEIIPTRELAGRYSAKHHMRFDNHAVLPGFVNSHCHTPMSLLRGIADDLPLKSWLEKHIWPLEVAHANDRFCAQGTELAVAELLRAGSTTVADMYFYPESSAEVFESAGMRARIGLSVMDFPTNWAQSIDEYFELGIKAFESFRHHPLISFQFAPHAPYTVSDGPMQRIASLAAELDIPIQMHVHETAHEVDEALSQTGKRPLQRLDELGLLGPQLQAVHMTQLTEAEIASLSDYGVHVVHCPESNMKLASGLCPVTALLDAGVNVALGTDGAASNNDLDMIGEMRSAAFLAKIQSQKATALSASQALAMATINGARALGLDEIIGSLEPGKQADIIAIDMSQIEQQPMFHPISQIVYSCDRKQISDVWVAGKHLMKNRELTTLDLEKIHFNAQAWQKTFYSGSQS